MIHEVDEEDPDLIKFVSSLILRPSYDKPLNLKSKPKQNDFSQIGQSLIIDELLNGKRNGFFVEAGGFDGETYSNSLFFELERGWNGVLIEPLPRQFRKLKAKNRKCFAINVCIAENKPQIVKFRSSSEAVLSGRDHLMDQRHRILMLSAKETSSDIFVPCFSLRTIMKALRIDKIDYFSLDIEGAEFQVLKNMHLESINVDITAFSIESNSDNNKSARIVDYLKTFNYSLVKEHLYDIILIKK